MIEYEKYFRHFDSWEGEGEVDEEEEEKKESKMIDKSITFLIYPLIIIFRS